jgi:hypothetical protein
MRRGRSAHTGKIGRHLGLFGRHFTTMDVPSEALCLSEKMCLGGFEQRQHTLAL